LFFIWRGEHTSLRALRFPVICWLLSTALAAAQPAAAPASAPPPRQPSQSANPSAPQPTASDTPSPEGKAGKDQNGQATSNGTSKDRLFFALPNFLTLENAGKIPPLTTGQKFKVVARSAFDYVEFPWYGFLAGISQADDSEPGYGQGAAGYGKRYGAALADGTIENFLTSAILPSVLHQDPRYYELGKGRFLHRLGYSLSRTVVTRSDSGYGQFNFSEVVGSALSAGISTYSYHPRSDRNLPNTASVWGTQVGYDTMTIVVKEFWPDIRRRLRRKGRDNLAKTP
jgi:hypothetical protein